MKCSRFAAPALVLLALLLAPAPAAAQVTFEAFIGTAFNAPTPLTITQTGFPAIKFTAHYEERPLDPIRYYAWRLGRWKGDKGWFLEHVHHKIHIDRPTAEVQAFEVSHGYNLVTINRGWRRGSTRFLLGGGVVVTFPHTEVRGKIYPQDTSYLLSGATIQGAASRRLDLTRRFFVSVEGKLTASWASIPVVDGHARVPNAAFHVLAGAGWQF